MGPQQSAQETGSASTGVQIDEHHGIWLGSEQTQGWIPPERESWIEDNGSYPSNRE